MKKQRGFLLSTVAVLLFLFCLPSNSRADTMLQNFAGPMNSYGHGVGWVMAMQAPGAGFRSAAVLSFSTDSPWVRGLSGGVVNPVSSVGRPRFGLSYWGWTPSVWTGTSYTYYDCNTGGDDDGGPTSAPEPGTVLLLASGMLGLLFFRRSAAAGTT